MKIAVVQMCSSADPWENLLRVNDYVHEAYRMGARLVCFPENVFFRGPKKTPDFERHEIFLSLDQHLKIVSQNEFSAAFSEFSKEWPVSVSLGSVLEANKFSEIPYNSHFWVYPKGEKIVSYKKIHLFKFEGQETTYDESKDVCAGSELKVVEQESIHFGLSVCFDLRFPELYRDLVLKEKSQILLIPAAFAYETGKVHWHTLLKARAIENQAYVVAAAQWGEHTDSREQKCRCFGETVVYGPWGECLLQADSEGDEILCFDADIMRQNRLRKSLPALSCVRFPL